jgi:O-succinylbenzoate synthase
LTNAVRIHDICRQAGIPCWVGGMLESATGVALCIALAMLDNFTYPADIFPTSRFYHADLSDPPIELHRDANGVPAVRAFEQLPEPNPERLRKLTVQSAVFK